MRSIPKRNVSQSDVKGLVHEYWDNVQPEDAKKWVEHVIKIEEKYRISMNVMEEIDPVIIRLGDDSDSDYAVSDNDEDS